MFCIRVLLELILMPAKYIQYPKYPVSYNKIVKKNRPLSFLDNVCLHLIKKGTAF